ncbi:MAG TPA: 8-amino-7-oxononanoate synthase [Puia sp.]|nr:8-amino-7-oxononanoate synthase [Puia sp.]
MKEAFLHKKLDERAAQNAFRQLRLPDGKTDFCSNDYLGIASSSFVTQDSGSRPPSLPPPPPGPPESVHPLRHGSGGSRLLAGNYSLIEETERQLAAFHEADAGLIFNSGYDANMGLLSSVPQRGDTVLYDYLSHASIRDGIRLSFARSFSFLHNDVDDLEKKLQAAAAAGGTIFVVTESVFSMDGDQAPLQEIARICALYGAHLIVDEAHATGVIGKKGEGLVQALGLQTACFARIHTFGKAVGCHGAMIAGSETLRNYLINFSRAFIYTTALPESSIQSIRKAYALFPQMDKERNHLQNLITRFQQASLGFERLNSNTPIQGVVVPGNEAVRALATRLQTAGLDVRPILYPTVPKGGERLRIVLHAFNTITELDKLIAHLS